MPIQIPLVAATLIWAGVLNGSSGWVNAILGALGLDGPDWIGDSSWVLVTLALIGIWSVGNMMLIFIAGLQGVPTELYDAARVDGAGVLQRFLHITLPLLRPIIVVATATRIIWTFNYADLIFVMTSGGPANATQITSTYTLLTAYSTLDFGYAATLSVVLLLIMLVFTILYLRITRGIERVA
jgi:multiple sugar transport system permease protein